MTDPVRLYDLAPWSHLTLNCTQLGLREFVRAQEWDPSAFSRMTVGDLIEVNNDAQWVFDLEALRMLVGHGAKKEQLEGLRMFGIVHLKAQQGLRLEPLKNGTLVLTDLLELDGDDFKMGIDELRELLTEGTTDKLLQKQLGHLRAFATRSQQVCCLPIDAPYPNKR